MIKFSSPLLTILRLFCLCSIFVPVSHTWGNNSDSVDPLNPEVAYGSEVSYAIYRNNKRIGTHSIRFSRENADLVVSVSSKLVVTVLKIPVYRFNYSASELWREGQLQEVRSKVTEKGETKTVSLQRQGDQVQLTEPAGNTTTATLDFASNHWHPGVLQANAIFNTLTGKANQINITSKGVEQLTVADQIIEATHYHYSGELQTDVWYDERLRWVKLQFKGSDGSVIEYRCEGFTS
ncbi:MAG: hypothetical protein KTR32_32580 [Granulosicoccus sp.]|nr:hypothetical protein [Granulosicoccus sp.]